VARPKAGWEIQRTAAPLIGHGGEGRGFCTAYYSEMGTVTHIKMYSTKIDEKAKRIIPCILAYEKRVPRASQNPPSTPLLILWI